VRAPPATGVVWGNPDARIVRGAFEIAMSIRARGD